MKTLIILAVALGASLALANEPTVVNVSLENVKCHAENLKIDEDLSVPIEVISVNSSDILGAENSELATIPVLQMRAPAHHKICERLANVPAHLTLITLKVSKSVNMHTYISTRTTYKLKSTMFAAMFLQLKGSFLTWDDVGRGNMGKGSVLQ